MDILREKAIKEIAEVLIEIFYSREGFANIQAENILSLPSLAAYYGSKGAGVVAKKECRHYGPNTSYADCPICGGKNEITREITNNEAVEYLKWRASNLFTTLPSGERVEIKEGE